MKVTLLILVLNEIDGMKVILPRIKKEWVEEILIVDGHSTDGSYEYAVQNGYQVIQQKGKGPVRAYYEAMEIAKGDVILTMSPDGNCVPELIPELVKKMREGYDMVIASRYLNGAKSEDDDPVTAFGNRLFTTMINILFRARCTDSLNMYRAWKKEIVQSFKIDASRAGVEPQLVIECAKRKLKVAEIPGDEPKRIGGIRKMSPIWNGLGILFLILRELID